MIISEKPTIRSWVPGCSIPVGWVIECIIACILIGTVRDLARSCAKMADIMEADRKLCSPSECGRTREELMSAYCAHEVR